VPGLLIGFESVQKGTQNEVKKIKNLKIDFYEACVDSMAKVSV